MDVIRSEQGAATVRLAHDEVRDLLGAFALSMAAYGLLQNFMLPHQKAMALPSIAFISRLGAMLAAGEEFGEATDGESVETSEGEAPRA
ncbi:MAG: hypothetical protein AB7R89_29965 [Dehalococcoidia bacterium]